MDSWLGATEHDVIMRMGTPANTSSDGDGGKIIRYTKERSTTTYNRNPYQVNKYDPSVISNTYDNTLYKEFFINKDGKVYSWRTNYPNPVELNKVATTAAVFVTALGLIIFTAILFSSDPSTP